MDINHKKKQYLGICKTCEAKENSESNWPIESSNDTYISNSNSNFAIFQSEYCQNVKMSKKLRPTYNGTTKCKEHLSLAN